MRFFLPPDQWTGDTVELDAAESHHAAAVLRVKPGDAAELLDGAGRTASAEVASVGKKCVTLRLGAVRRAPARTGRLVLAVAVPKGQTMEWIVEKAVELGASDVFPMLTQRTIVRLAPDERAARRTKWQRVALEATKQCGQPWLPTVHTPAGLAETLSALPAAEFDLPLVACLEPDSRPLRETVRALPSRPRSGAVIIGPEGDLTADEYAACRAAGFRPVSLGNIVLRVETAALHVLSVLTHEMGTS